MKCALCPGTDHETKDCQVACPDCGQRRSGIIGEGDCCPGGSLCPAKAKPDVAGAEDPFKAAMRAAIEGS